MELQKIYVGTYKVYRVFKKSRKRVIIEKGLTREQAKKLVQSFPDSNTSMVVFDKQFSTDRYYKPDFRICTYSNTVRLFPQNYWIASIKGNSLVFNSWEGMTKRLFENKEITEKQVINFYNKNK